MHRLSDTVMQAQFQGVLFVRRANETANEAGCGWADHRTARPNTPQTPFQFASVSKQLTAAAILLLQVQGALLVHDPLQRWLPECSAEWHRIVLVLAHFLKKQRLVLFTPTVGIGLAHATPPDLILIANDPSVALSQGNESIAPFFS